MRKFRLSLVEDNIVLSSSCCKPWKHAQLELVVSIDYEKYTRSQEERNQPHGVGLCLGQRNRANCLMAGVPSSLLL